MANTFKSGSNPSGITDSIFRGEFTIGLGAQGPTVPDTGYYNGITPPSGGYAIYQTKPTQGPSIRIASDGNGLITIAQQYGGTNISTVTDALNYLNSLSNTIVTNFDYENIVTDGLLINVDAGFTPSYPTTGSTWYDLSGGTRNSTLFNTPSYSSSNSGSLNFSTASLNYGTIPNIGTIQNWTAEVWVKFNSTTTNQVAMVLGNQYNGSTSINFTIGTNGAPTSWNIQAGFFQNGWFTTTGFTPVIGTWYQVVGTYDGTTIRQYVNGVANGGTVNITRTLQSGGEVRIMRRWDSTVNSNDLFNGNLAIARVYNKALEASEVLQNFNAQKGRFGL